VIRTRLTRRAFAFGLVAVLPVCAAAAGYGARHGAVMLDGPKGRVDHLLVRALETRLGRANPGRYGLSYSIRFEGGTPRETLSGEVTYALRDLRTRRVLTSGKARHVACATLVEKRHAREQMIRRLAGQIAARLEGAVPKSVL